ncbi:hypothetical protein BGZ98_007850, partial [Dissophora globulifera]
MDHQGHRYSTGPYGASGTSGGYGYGSALSYATGGPYAYSNPRATFGPTHAGLPYLPSLQRCVATLESSTQLLKSVVAQLDETTNGYPRLKTITSSNKQFELVSEHELASAQVGIAKDVEPQLFHLTEKAVQAVLDLEGEEYQLMARVQQETAKQERRIQRQIAAKSGISNIKHLQSLIRRKEELSRGSTELEDVLDSKRQEFAQIVARMEAQSDQQGSGKRLRRNPTNESRELALKEDERRKEAAKRSQELDALQQKIDDKRRAIHELRSKSLSQSGSRYSEHTDFNPTLPWSMYSEHHKFLEEAMQTPIHVQAQDQGAYEEAFARIMTTYFQELESQQAKTDNELNTLTRGKTRKLSQMRNLCKRLFPGDSIGKTMTRVLELLVESPENEIYHKELVQ